jgi:hypothetical protein
MNDIRKYNEMDFSIERKYLQNKQQMKNLYPEYTGNSSKLRKASQKKGKYLKRHFTNEDVQMANKHKTAHSISSQEIKINTQ